MKKILLIVTLLLTVSINVNAFDFTRLIFESVIETDRNQTYIWGGYTKENPLITPSGYVRYEQNPLIAGRSKNHIDNYFDFFKEFSKKRNGKINSTIDSLIYYGMILLELDVIIRNNKLSKIKGDPQIWTIAYSWQF